MFSQIAAGVTSFSMTPINGISKLTKLFFARKTQKITSYLLKIKTKVTISCIALLALMPILMVNPAFSAEIGRYQVVTSGTDNAYLVDTTTGFTWILSYRTMPTGREPVAIPYKFIAVTPQKQGSFLLENAPTSPDLSKETK